MRIVLTDGSGVKWTTDLPPPFGNRDPQDCARRSFVGGVEGRHRSARELTEDRMSSKVWTPQLQLLTKVTKARLTARQAFMATMLGNVRQLLRDLPLDQPLIDHTDEEIIDLVKKVFREPSAKRASLLNRSIGRRKQKRTARIFDLSTGGGACLQKHGPKPSK
jgi:hypothetical protein